MVLYEIIPLICLVAIFGIANARETIVKDLSGLSGPSDEHELLVIGQNRSTTGEGEGRKRSRRLSVKNEECVLYEYSAEGPEALYNEDIDPKDEVDDGDVWYCEFDKAYAESIGLEDHLVLLDGWEPSEDDFNGNDGGFLDRQFDEDEDEDGDVVNNYITSGTTTLRINAAIIDLDDNSLFVESESVELSNGDNDFSGRKLQWSQVVPKVGTRKVIVVRILTYDSSSQPAVSAKQIRDSVYEKDFSFKKIYEACSYNKLKMEDFRGNTTTDLFVEDGIVDVYLNEQQSDFVNSKIASGFMGKYARDKITRYARIRTKLALGDLEQFDFVMFAMPDGLFGTLAFAALNRYDSYYFENWLARPSFPLHEIGHNLGMNHAGEFGIYDDKVGYMGYSYENLEGPIMCFNPANSFYLGWYKDQTSSYNAYSSGAGKEFTLNGICDYEPAKAGFGGDRKLVVLQLTQIGKDRDFYIGYNRQKGINSGTYEDANQILILKKFGPADSSLQTQKLATLAEVGDYYEIKKYSSDKNQKRPVYISWETKKNNGKDVVIKISTEKPTLKPTKSPTRAPTFQPTPDGGVKDRDDLKYKGSKQKGCDWVANKPNDRCQKKSKGKLIETYWCIKTCEDQTYCEDSTELKYSNNKEKNCSWVGEDTDKRCGKSWKGETIESYWCPTTCNGNCGEAANTSTAKSKTGWGQEDKIGVR